MWLITDLGERFRAVCWPNCVTVPVVRSTDHWEPNEPSYTAVGCSCAPTILATVHVVERAGLTNTVMHCTFCHDTRVTRSVG